ncbi:MAG: cupin domain-containing protein [Pseudomonadota bacterium]
MRNAVRFGADALEYETEERCAIVEVANDVGDADVSIARARVRPGVTTAWHKLDGIDERYLIVAGTGRVEVGDSIVEDVRPGDVVRISADERQRITNTGSNDLLFYAICSPRFDAACYIALE